MSFSPDGQQLVTIGEDRSVRIWDATTGECVCVETVVTPSYDPLCVTFIARADFAKQLGTTRLGDPQLVIQPVGDRRDFTAPSAISQVVSAKIVLVGESNVGKSYLAHRLATGTAPEDGTIKSTHGMQFWPVAPEQLHESAKAPPGQRRDIMLWDMGGQEEYRLVHQLFLRDTTVALLLLVPTRGAVAFTEMEAWNKYLQKQLQNHRAVKLLVGSKLDEPSAIVDSIALERLCSDLDFKQYLESSAITGRGMDDLRQAIASAIPWDELSKTSRPELFQRIHDEIEARRNRREVVLHVSDLLRAISASPTSDEQAAVNTVIEQLANQGLVACSQVATGEPVLVLQIQEIERYAGSLIMAARNNPRGVPALEVRALARPDFTFPGIDEQQRLEREHERPILECCVRLLLEHGICFEHESLLVFPTLFPAGASSTTPQRELPHAVSLYYDFAGAIDNIYASLIAWLVLTRDFGGIRLWQDRAEFEVKNSGLCGLRKVARHGGFAHVDVYFENDTPEHKRREFISFVEDHLKTNGVEILEHIDIHCPCGHDFGEETLQKRIARGDKDIACPLCETRHSLLEGAAKVRERDPQILQGTWALKHLVAEERRTVARKAVQPLEATRDSELPATPIRVLHLSDLHFNADTAVDTRLQWLLDDLKLDTGLGIGSLDYLVVSGDFTDRGSPEGFDKAFEFLSGLIRHFDLSAERCILTPGNHDVANLREAYEWRESADGLDAGTWVKQGDIILARNVTHYPLRFKQFSDRFYHKLRQLPYPVDYAAQGRAIPFWDTGIQFLTLNSCWEIDQFNRQRAGIHADAVAAVIAQAQQQESDARKTGHLLESSPRDATTKKERPILRIAVWHHSVTAPEYKLKDLEFLTNLQKNRVQLGLHGDVHEMRRELIGYWHPQRMHVICAGSFGARPEERPEATPCLYNVLEISRDLRHIRVHARCQRTPNGAWEGWYEWPDKTNPGARVAHYDIDLTLSP